LLRLRKLIKNNSQLILIAINFNQNFLTKLLIRFNHSWMITFSHMHQRERDEEGRIYGTVSTLATTKMNNFDTPLSLSLSLSISLSLYLSRSPLLSLSLYLSLSLLPLSRPLSLSFCLYTPSQSRNLSLSFTYTYSHSLSLFFFE